jgi:hypothetical protein
VWYHLTNTGGAMTTPATITIQYYNAAGDLVSLTQTFQLANGASVDIRVDGIQIGSNIVSVSITGLPSQSPVASPIPSSVKPQCKTGQGGE